MNHSKFHAIGLAVACMLAYGPALSQDVCAPIGPQEKQEIAGVIDEAKMARELGDYDLALERLYAIRSDIGSLTSIPSRCMGPDLWRRHYAEWQLAESEFGRREESSGSRAGVLNALGRYASADNRDAVDRMLEALPVSARAYSSAAGTLRDELAGYQWAIENGFSLIPEEAGAIDFYRSRLERLTAVGREKADEILAAEARAFGGPMTAEEQQLLDAQNAMATVTGAMVGENALPGTAESRRMTQRARQSVDQLREARGWLAVDGIDAAKPAIERARVRGDAMMQAGDGAENIEARDDYYQAAINYFALAGAENELAAAEAAQAEIQPELDAYRDAREARLQKKADEMRESAEDFRKSVEKTDAEKESFRNEADALEDELGL